MEPFCFAPRCRFPNLLGVCYVLIGESSQNGFPGILLSYPSGILCHIIENYWRHIDRKRWQAGLDSRFNLNTSLESWMTVVSKGQKIIQL